MLVLIRGLLVPNFYHSRQPLGPTDSYPHTSRVIHHHKSLCHLEIKYKIPCVTPQPELEYGLRDLHVQASPRVCDERSTAHLGARIYRWCSPPVMAPRLEQTSASPQPFRRAGGMWEARQGAGMRRRMCREKGRRMKRPKSTEKKRRLSDRR
jgi:hypothetical protein